MLNTNTIFQCCGAGPEAKEQKLNCLPEPEQKLRITAPAPHPYNLLKTWRNFIEKKS